MGDEAILFQRHRDGVGDLVIAVVLVGLDLDSVYDVASAWNPPCEQFGQTLVRETFDLTIERYDSIGNCDRDVVNSIRGRLYGRSGTALFGGLSLTASERSFLQHRGAYVISDRTVTHRLSRSDPNPVDDPS